MSLGGTTVPSTGEWTWYKTAFQLRESWLGNFNPVVGLRGLETDEIHRALWELLTLHTNKDFTPTYLLNPALPTPPQTDKAGRDWATYIPPGILRVRWTEKQRSLPGVLVLFVKESLGRDAVVKILGDVRGECAVSGTQLLVMLIKGPGEEEVSTEKASAYCTVADIPPKSLYILVTNHPIHTSVQRLETGIKEACKNYYAARIRKVKASKERPTHPSLQIRYNIKLAFFHEVRRDYVSACSHYEAALDGLIKLGAYRHEVRVVATLLSYRRCRLLLLKREWREATTTFQNHIQTFLTGYEDSSDGDNLDFEYLAFLQQQYYNFGELTKQAYRTEGGIMGLDPVPYFITAAKYAQQRVALLCKIEGGVANPFTTEELEAIKSWDEEYFGHKPPLLEGNQNNKQLLQFLESTVPHSEYIINHLGLASEFCKEIGRLRYRSQLMSMMGEEFLRSGEYPRCILLMSHVLREFGNERWHEILLHVAKVGLAAAISIADIPAYISFSVILLKRNLRSLLTAEEGRQISLNLEAVMNKRVPQHDKVNAELFVKALNTAEEIKSYVGVHSKPLLDTWIGLDQDVVVVNKSVKVTFKFRNCHDQPIFVRSIAIQTSMPEYDSQQVVGKWIQIGETGEACIDVAPAAKDANKIIQLQVGQVDIGREGVSVLLHYSLILKSLTTSWQEWKEERRGLNVVKIEGNKPCLQCDVVRNDQCLVGEVHTIKFKWTNHNVHPLTRIHLSFFLSATNPHVVRLSPDAGFVGAEGGGLSHSVEVDRLGGAAVGDAGDGDSLSSWHEVTLYLRVSDQTELRLLAKAKYVDFTGQHIATDFVTPISVVAPFTVSTSVTTIRGEPLQALTPQQPFLLLYKLINISPTTITLVKVDFNVSKECLVQRAASAGTWDTLTFKPTETVNTMQYLALNTMEVPEDLTNAVCMTVYWRRSNGCDHDNVHVAKTEFWPPLPVPSAQDITTNFFVTAVYGEDAYLKQPFSVTYFVVNRTASCYDVCISLDSTEYFMNAGTKRMNVKLNGTDNVELSYILFPLKTGLVNAPRLIIEGVDASHPPLPPIVRDVPKTIFVRRGKGRHENESEQVATDDNTQGS